MRVTVIGAGVTGLACAVELAEQGADVELLERGAQPGVAGCSWFAGGMLAPWCERADTEPWVAALGEESSAWWGKQFPGTVQQGTLVVAHARDGAELNRFARRTQNAQWLGQEGIAALEPDLAGRFDRALFFATEAHLDPRSAVRHLACRLTELGGCIRYGVEASASRIDGGQVIDCRGMAARDVLPDLRGVKGEMLLLHSRELAFTRPIRILHPRLPLYVVPRGEGLFMVGATSLECSEHSRVTARSLLELLGAAYALHPAFGEAQVVEIGTGVRAAFPDNRPRLRWHDRVLYVNGLYRHGFLLAPAIARRVADTVFHNRCFPEVMDENHRERRCS
jgi:glycine oxidase